MISPFAISNHSQPSLSIEKFAVELKHICARTSKIWINSIELMASIRTPPPDIMKFFIQTYHLIDLSQTIFKVYKSSCQDKFNSMEDLEKKQWLTAVTYSSLFLSLKKLRLMPKVKPTESTSFMIFQDEFEKTLPHLTNFLSKVDFNQNYATLLDFDTKNPIFGDINILKKTNMLVLDICSLYNEHFLKDKSDTGVLLGSTSSFIILHRFAILLSVAFNVKTEGGVNIFSDMRYDNEKINTLRKTQAFAFFEAAELLLDTKVLSLMKEQLPHLELPDLYVKPAEILCKIFQYNNEHDYPVEQIKASLDRVAKAFNKPAIGFLHDVLESKICALRKP